MHRTSLGSTDTGPQGRVRACIGSGEESVKDGDGTERSGVLHGVSVLASGEAESGRLSRHTRCRTYASSGLMWRLETAQQGPQERGQYGLLLR